MVVETLSLDTINANSLHSLQQTLQTMQRLRVGTELVRSGSSYDILWGGLQKLKYYMMEKIIVDVAWCDRNYGGSLGSNVPGAVVFTAPTFEALQKEAKDRLEFHVEGLVENGEDVPEWLKNGDYEFVYNYQDATTLLKAYSPYVSLAAISRASGINQSLLSHYVNGLKKPREQQRKRIVEGLHKIGSDLQSVMCV